jgi:hypothetical protein
MENLLRVIRALAPRLEPEEPSIRPGTSTCLDQLPPVLGPSDWSNSLLHMMAESSAAWYFDRR